MFLTVQLEDRVKEMNRRIQVKMQQQKNSTHNSETDNQLPPNTNTTTTATITTTASTTPKSAVLKQDGTTIQPVTRFKMDDGVVATDNNSDSGLASWSMTRSPKASASDSEPFC